MTTTLFYSSAARGDASGDGYCHQVTLEATYDLTDDTWLDSIAEQCADDWHSNHDGWEASWPRVFALYASKEGPAIAHMEVERETVAQFMATPV
jgi:hypothetical protein